MTTLIAGFEAEGFQQRLETYFEKMGKVLGGNGVVNAARRSSFATYAMGLLGEGDRKSMEPIAARASADPKLIDAQHQRLGHFINDTHWSDEEVRLEAARHALQYMTVRNPISAWILDDTGFLKQGKHSVGVQRQYTGSAGKITNCQVGTSLCVATATDHLPIDFELYLPKAWMEDKDRREEAKIPNEMEFKTKPELALQMIDRALKNQLPKGVVLADEGYGNSKEFRQSLRSRNMDYGVSIASTTAVWLVDRNGALRSKRKSVKKLALELGEKGFRRTMWRDGTRGLLHARFAARRVVVGTQRGRAPREREAEWLLMEWRDGESEPAHFHLVTLPANTPRKKLVRIVKERYRTERAYEDLKGELGLDHFEGRRFAGWHHHVSVALCCYAFVIAEKLRAFFSTTRRQRGTRSLRIPSGETFPGFLHHYSSCDCSPSQHMAPTVPHLPPREFVSLSRQTPPSPQENGIPLMTQ